MIMCVIPSVVYVQKDFPYEELQNHKSGLGVLCMWL
jgi:hypothetical protein